MFNLLKRLKTEVDCLMLFASGRVIETNGGWFVKSSITNQIIYLAMSNT